MLPQSVKSMHIFSLINLQIAENRGRMWQKRRQILHFIILLFVIYTQPLSNGPMTSYLALQSDQIT